MYGEAKVKDFTKVDFLPIKKVDDVIIGSYHLQKSTIESEEVFFNPGWFGSAEDTIYSLIPSEDIFGSVSPNIIAL